MTRKRPQNADRPTNNEHCTVTKHTGLIRAQRKETAQTNKLSDQQPTPVQVYGQHKQQWGGGGAVAEEGGWGRQLTEACRDRTATRRDRRNPARVCRRPASGDFASTARRQTKWRVDYNETAATQRWGDFSLQRGNIFVATYSINEHKKSNSIAWWCKA